jgi:lactoylglutathione lyase
LRRKSRRKIYHARSRCANTQAAFQPGHIGLNVSDLDRSVKFYQNIFGFETMKLSQEPERAFAFLGLDGKLLVTLWQQSAGMFPKNLPGLRHLSFQVPTIEEVKRAETRLRGIGATVFHNGIVLHSEGASSGGVFFLDPDGIRLEIYAPAGADAPPAPHGTAPTRGFF